MPLVEVEQLERELEAVLLHAAGSAELREWGRLADVLDLLAKAVQIVNQQRRNLERRQP